MVLLFVNKSIAQNGFETQFNIGIPINSYSKEISNFNMSLDLAYLFTKKIESSLDDGNNTLNGEPVNFKTLQYGFSAGYLQAFN